MARKFKTHNSGNGLTVILVGVVVLVFALGVIAVWGVVRDNVAQSKRDALQDKLDSFTATAGERADDLGMNFEDFLAYYGLTDSGLSADDEEQKVYESMTLANFVKFNVGTEFTEDEFEEFKAAQGLGDDVTPDSTDMDVKSQYIAYYQAQQEESEAESDTTLDTSADTAE